MSKKLLIVESPAKAKTIQHYLGKDFTVLATLGHIIDLPKNKLGVDVDNNYEMEYKMLPGKRKVLSAIKKAAKEAEVIYLAQDPDREGEAIAWQVKQLLKLKKSQQILRTVFHEVTKDAVKQAVESPRDLDMNLVEAQQTRRILDRLVGYLLSGLLWKKIRYGLSAGRVQSAALRLIVEREEEIKNFKSEKFFYLRALDTNKNEFFLVHRTDSLTYKKYKLNKKDATLLLEKVRNVQDWHIRDVIIKDTKINPPPAFTTSTLQQVANKNFGYTAKYTMSLAQKLYQGVDVAGRGRVGLITYMRTDSVKISNRAVSAIRQFIKSNYGDVFLCKTPRIYKNKAKNAQEAHEAIRPTYIDITPDSLKGQLDTPLLKLYTLIWKRAVATQMSPAIYSNLKVCVENNLELNDFRDAEFAMFKKVLKEPGYLKLYDKEPDIKYKLDSIYSVDHSIILKDFSILENETLPPSRYSDATLVKKLESLGIGRPSTYATIIATLILRNYVERRNKLLYPTDNGVVVSNFLVKYFPNIVDYGFTAAMEDKLDQIATGKETKIHVLDNFYPSFKEDLDSKMSTIKKEDVVILGTTDKVCPKCGAPMVLKIGKYGKFYSCSKFPECTGMLPFLDEEKYVIPDEARSGEYVLKVSRYGKFWAHKDYPKVKKTMPLLLKATCPKCGAHLVERRSKKGKSFIGCSNYPKCNYIAKG